MLKKIYNLLYSSYGAQGWWPLSKGGLHSLHYQGNPENDRDIFEIMVGAILTQNTSWSNVEKALYNLNKASVLSVDGIISTSDKKLASLLKPSGYYNMKAKKLKKLASFILQNPLSKLSRLAELRETLLSLYGIGNETADSILLYAFSRPYFVIDAYTKRIFSRIGIKGLSSYDDWQDYFMKNLTPDVGMYKEYHALIVAHAKQHCRAKPLCSGCCLNKLCEKNI
jgi:endonuclease-3 related protein